MASSAKTRVWLPYKELFFWNLHLYFPTATFCPEVSTLSGRQNPILCPKLSADKTGSWCDWICSRGHYRMRTNWLGRIGQATWTVLDWPRALCKIQVGVDVTGVISLYIVRMLSQDINYYRCTDDILTGTGTPNDQAHAHGTALLHLAQSTKSLHIKSSTLNPTRPPTSPPLPRCALQA
jgi:hypothetical protein